MSINSSNNRSGKRISLTLGIVFLIFCHSILFSQNSQLVRKEYDYIQKGINVNEIKDFIFDTSIVKTYSDDVNLVLSGSKTPSGGNDFTWLLMAIKGRDTIYRALFNHPYVNPNFGLIQEDFQTLFFTESLNWGTGQMTNKIHFVNLIDQEIKDFELLSLLSSPNLCDYYFSIRLQDINTNGDNVVLKYEISYFDIDKGQQNVFIYPFKIRQIRRTNLIDRLIKDDYKGEFCSFKIIKNIRKLYLRYK